MFKAARVKKIKEIMIDRGQIDVSTLASLLDVTDVTVRADLELLENQGFIIRTHGGAVLNEEYINQKRINDLCNGSSIEYNKDKDHIGQIAANLVEENEWIFLSGGETCYYIAKALLDYHSW